MTAPHQWSHDDAWSVCRPHPRYFAIGLLIAALALLAIGARSEGRLVLIGEAIGFAVCVSVAITARVHVRAQVPLAGRYPDGRLVLIAEGPGVHALMRRVRDPYGGLHRDISLTYALAAGVLLPTSALLIIGTLYGHTDIAIGILYGLLAGIGVVLAWRPMHATWWAMRSGGTILNPKVASPPLAAYADLHGEHTVAMGIPDQELRTMLDKHPDIAANVAEVTRMLGADPASNRPSPADTASESPDPEHATDDDRGEVSGGRKQPAHTPPPGGHSPLPAAERHQRPDYNQRNRPAGSPSTNQQPLRHPPSGPEPSGPHTSGSGPANWGPANWGQAERGRPNRR